MKKYVDESLKLVHCRKCVDKKCESKGRNNFTLEMLEEEGKAILRCSFCKFNSIWFWPFKVMYLGVEESDLDDSEWLICQCSLCRCRTLHYWKECDPSNR